MGRARRPSPPISSAPRSRAASAAPWLLGLATLALAVLALAVHRTPFYGVETDLFGDLIPAARALRALHPTAANFQFKGPGYPLLLALTGALTGDDWFAARLLDVIAAAVGAWFTYRIARRFLSPAAGLFVMLGLFADSVWLGAATEAGTDMPAFALSMVAIDRVLGARSPRAAWLAGLVAGMAVITRYNAAFLPLAALLAFALRAREAPAGAPPGPDPARVLLPGYALGFVAPVAAWAVVARLLPGGPWRDLNHLNVAYEIYGRQMSWDDYWPIAARAFHSLADVVRLDPPRVARTLAGNVATRWWSDAQRLLPWWLGAPALLGIALAWPRRRGAAALAVHPLLAYLMLAAVFYSARFFLVLIPFYLMGAAALLFHPPAPAWLAPRLATRLARGVTAALAAVALLGCAFESVAPLRQALAAAPVETRLAGAALSRLGPPGARVMARKPQVAYFAAMEHVPFADERSLPGVLRAARERHAGYLFYSSIEASLRPELLVLADGRFAAPGLEPLATPAPPPGHPYALYRLTAGPLDEAAFADSARHGVLAFAARHAGEAPVQWCAAATLLDLDRPLDALTVLDRAERDSPDAPQTAVLEAIVRFRIGDRAGGEAASRDALMAGVAPSAMLQLLSASLASHGDLADARRALERATTSDPLDPAARLRLAIVEFELGDSAAARGSLARCRALDPALVARCDTVRAGFAPGGDRAAARAVAGHLPPPRVDLGGLLAIHGR